MASAQRTARAGPSVVAKLGSALGGGEDIGEEHGREDALRLTRLPRPRQELLDLVEHGVRVTDEE